MLNTSLTHLYLYNLLTSPLFALQPQHSHNLMHSSIMGSFSSVFFSSFSIIKAEQTSFSHVLDTLLKSSDESLNNSQFSSAIMLDKATEYIFTQCRFSHINSYSSAAVFQIKNPDVSLTLLHCTFFECRSDLSCGIANSTVNSVDIRYNCITQCGSNSINTLFLCNLRKEFYLTKTEFTYIIGGSFHTNYATASAEYVNSTLINSNHYHFHFGFHPYRGYYSFSNVYKCSCATIFSPSNADGQDVANTHCNIVKCAATGNMFLRLWGKNTIIDSFVFTGNQNLTIYLANQGVRYCIRNTVFDCEISNPYVIFEGCTFDVLFPSTLDNPRHVQCIDYTQSFTSNTEVRNLQHFRLFSMALLL